MSFMKFKRKIWHLSCFEIVDMTNVCQNLTAFLADIRLLEGRMETDIRETLTLLMCADCSTFCALLDSCGPFLALFSPSESFLHMVPMERLCAIARST